MNPFVADPAWGWWIIGYFFLGGIAAGAYFLATLIDMIGNDDDRRLARVGYRIAFPLIGVCGIFLIVDLERPERFWHMMFQSVVVHSALDDGWPAGGWGDMLRSPILKWWSPMSIGAWAIGLFSACSFLSFGASFWQQGFLARWLGRNWFGYTFHIIGSGLGFFVASYTGVLLGATNQPVWSISDWIAPLFLTSATSTAIAVLLLLNHGVSPQTRDRLERADLWALGLELGLFLIFLASLGGVLPLVLQTWQGGVLVGGTLIVGLLIPLALHSRTSASHAGPVMLAALFALAGGFMLRFGIVSIAPALLRLANGQPFESADLPLRSHWLGWALIGMTLLLAVGIPLLLRKQWRLDAASTMLAGTASLLVTAGVLYYAIPLEAAFWSPEQGRPRGGGVGASIFNRPTVVEPPSKIHKGDEP